MNEYKKILLLGSEGQIGSYLTHYLDSKNYQVIQFDVSRNEEEDLRCYPNTRLEEAMKECDFVFFLAFDVGGSLYMKKYQDTYQFIDNNIKILNTVFSSLNRYQKPFIYLSSQMANMMHSTYGILKLIGDRYTRSLGGIIVKLWNVYGVESDLEKSHVITDFILMAKNEGVIRMKTDGMEERQFLHAEDCSRALEIIMSNYAELDKTKAIDLTSFEWVSIFDIANSVSQYFDNCAIQKSSESDSIQLNAKNEPDDRILQYWKPKFTIETGIKNIIENMIY